MIQFFCYFVPPFICIKFFEKTQKIKLGNKKFWTLYIIHTGIINILCFGVITVFFRKPNYILKRELFSIPFALKYLLLSVAFALILPCLYFFADKMQLFGRNDIAFTNKEKLTLSAIVSFCFVFTVIIFTP